MRNVTSSRHPRLALYCIEHETINIDLSNKPNWISSLNPERKVPILEFIENGKIKQIVESEQDKELTHLNTSGSIRVPYPV